MVPIDPKSFADKSVDQLAILYKANLLQKDHINKILALKFANNVPELEKAKATILQAREDKIAQDAKLTERVENIGTATTAFRNASGEPRKFKILKPSTWFPAIFNQLSRFGHWVADGFSSLFGRAKKQ